MMIAKPNCDYKKNEISYVSRTCFRYYAVLTKTRSKMTPAIFFPRQNGTGSHRVCTLSQLGKTCCRTRTKILRSLFMCRHQKKNSYQQVKYQPIFVTIFFLTSFLKICLLTCPRVSFVFLGNSPDLLTT